MKSEIAQFGKLEIDLKELAQFIIEGKKRGFAGGGEYKTLEDGSNVFTFQKNNFHYEDRYWGSNQAPGRELVRWQNEIGQGLWFMGYSGGMLPKFWGNKELTKETFNFLKDMLSRITPKKPFRGPLHLIQEKDDKGNLWVYSNSANGDLKQFKGDEFISNSKEDSIVFKQSYIGGLIIP